MKELEILDPTAEQEATHWSLAAPLEAGRAIRVGLLDITKPRGELFLDELCQKAGVDPLEWRMKHDAEDIRLDQWRFAADTCGWDKLRKRKNEAGAGIQRASSTCHMKGNCT